MMLVAVSETKQRKYCFSAVYTKVETVKETQYDKDVRGGSRMLSESVVTIQLYRYGFSSSNGDMCRDKQQQVWG